MTRLSIDFETFSKADLRKVGIDVYARHPSTEVLMISWAYDDDPVEQVDFTAGQNLPAEVRADLRNPSAIKSAWNSTFERNIFKHVMGIEIPLDQWEDPMAVAYGLALPGSLGRCGAAVGLPTDKAKDSRGSALIRKFCVPRKPTKMLHHTRATAATDPQDWEDFLSYNRQDVEAERAIWKRIRKWAPSEKEWAMWRLDQKINDAGIPINLKMVRNATALYQEFLQQHLDEIQALTGVDNPNSRAQLLDWLVEHEYPYEDLTKASVQRALGLQGLPPTTRRVVELRAEAAKTSVKKFDALERATGPDSNLRYTIQYCGAGRTGRFSGRIYQPQNLPRPTREIEPIMEIAAANVEHLDAEMIAMLYDDPMGLLVSCIRPAAQAPLGFVFADADLGAIENRVLGWAAGCEKILDVFRANRDPYVDFATYMFKQDYETLIAEVRSGNKDKRTLAKPAVLGSGYGMSAGEERRNNITGEMEATGLLGYARGMGINMTVAEAQHATDVFRGTFTEVVDFWYALERAAKAAIRSRSTTRCGRFQLSIDGPFLRIKLPSGRSLSYCQPRVEPQRAPWGEMRDTITYMGLNDQNQWVRLKTRGAKLVENVVQAVARDLLVEGLLLADKKGLDVRMHIHDQIVALVPEATAERDLETLIECMTTNPSWAPDLPLGADGFTSKVFKKD